MAQTDPLASNQWCAERNAQVKQLRDLAHSLSGADLAALAWAIQHLDGLPEYWVAVDGSDPEEVAMARELERLRRAHETGARRCLFGGSYGMCELEDGHDGKHQITTSPRS